MQGFVIMKIDWEYDDENYYRPEGGGGNPVKVFTNPSKALKICQEMNSKEESNSIPIVYEVVSVEIEK